MSATQSMSESEMQVMRILWDTEEEMTSARIIEALEPSTGWKPSTVWTFLGRLVEKGFLSARKEGKRSLYSPAITEEAYRQMQTTRFLDTVHGGSVSSFFAALSGGSRLTEEEVAELRQWLAHETGGET